MSNESGIPGFGAVEMDAIGEIQNITMGSAATAVSNLLNAKVWITTPRVNIVPADELIFPDLEPSVRVKINYIKGVSGSSIMVLKQSDVQLILAQLMGQPLVVTDDFEFDEMNISAVCEVMNQMMGASATALSELINIPVDISTPEAEISSKDNKVEYFPTENPHDNVVQISFNLTVDGVINSEFISILDLHLAKMMAEKMMGGFGEAVDEALKAPPQSAPEPEPAPVPGKSLSQEEIERLLNPASQPAPQPAPQAQPVQQPYPQQPPYPQPVPPQYGMPPQYDPNQMYAQNPTYQMPPQYGIPPQYGYPPQAQKPNPVNVQNVQLHSFEKFDAPVDLTTDQTDNLRLLMGVPLDVTVEIGSARKKVKEILDFQQGTIIELERQAGAPVDVIVNGHLIAHGDVVVIEDNFAVRITEIVKSKFLDSLGNKE